MNQKQIERCDALWRELLAAGKVRWMAGMLARDSTDGRRRSRITSLGGPADPLLATRSVWAPVWTDPATIGCLVAMAREAFSGEVWVRHLGHKWLVEWVDDRSPQSYDRHAWTAETEAEAILLAIKEAE